MILPRFRVSMLNKDDQIEKLIEQNDELENYFRNTIIPQLFVDANLILQKFTPPAMRQFTLSKEDIGRSITDIKENSASLRSSKIFSM